MVLINAPYIDQTVDWPTGCESVSTVMLLKYLGLPITVEEFVENCLQKEPMITKDGKLYGPNPRVSFAGDPKNPDSFGAYAPVITAALDKALTNTNYKAVDLTGVPVDNLLTEYIDNGKPVIFWASIDLKETIKGPSWTISATGEGFEWISNEHCMLLVGYDDKNYYFNDPWHNHGVIGYEKNLVEKRHEEQMSMAVSYLSM